MSAAIAEEAMLKVHTAPDGVVWYADGTASPRSSRLLSDDFVHSDLFSQPRGVRVLGTAANVDLLVGLYQKLGQQVTRCEVASPLICASRRELTDPLATLFRMRQCLLPSSLGGWHVVTVGDYISYAIAKRLRDAPGDLDVVGMSLLQRHPAWPALRFLRDLHPYFAATVIAIIRDPRWYVSPVAPDRTNKIRRFMGLDMHVQQVVSSSASLIIDEAARRNFSVLATWQHREPPSAAEMSIPGHFLWRVWSAAGRGVKGDLRASQMFLSFLQYAWLQGLNRRQCDIFDTSRIFKTDDECEAYKEHIANFPPAV